MLFISITLVIGTMILGYIYSKRVSKRIEDITDTTVQIADGNLAIELNENGNDELSVLAKDMNSLIAQLRQQKQEEEEKKDLLSLGSHQLRSPLNRVAWALQMLESSKKLKPAERHELMQQACVGVRRMRQIVSTILTLSSIERNNLTPQAQKIAVKELLEEVVENYEQDLQSKKQSLTIRCNKTLRISSDRNIIAQVLDNLVGNASKYTPSEGSIVIKAKKDADTLVLSVSDTGFGIPRDQEDKIFQKYCRAKTDDTKHIAGSGLGLYLSKILLTTIQGKIHFTSAAGNGTTFTIILPLSLNV